MFSSKSLTKLEALTVLIGKTPQPPPELHKCAFSKFNVMYVHLFRDRAHFFKTLREKPKLLKLVYECIMFINTYFSPII
jgi:hypothetical protein